MRFPLVSAAALAVAASASTAQTVEYRIVEREGQSVVTGPADPELNFAVQIRVTGAAAGVGVSSAALTLLIAGELETSGTLARCRISNPDRTYSSDIALDSLVGSGGLAAQYTYLALLSGNFNGLINTSAGPFTNTPSQEIGTVFGFASGPGLLATPGLDADHDGSPDTWSGNGGSTAPTSGATAALDPSVASNYFGAGGNWVDLYRFRYTLTNFASRTLTLHLSELDARVFSSLHYTSQWQPATATPAGEVATDLSILVSATGSGLCCSGEGACSVSTGTACTGSFLVGTSCEPNPCPQPGACCSATTGACTIVRQHACFNTWNGADSCTPQPCPQPGRCCSTTGACTYVLQSLCDSDWSAGVCTAPPCPQPGRCCNTTTGACVVRLQSACTGTFIGGSSVCNPNPCPPASKCCLSDGACTITTALACTGVWSFGGSCSPNICPQPGRCCRSGGECSITVPVACAGDWLAAGSCSPNPCTTLGACCSGTTCTSTDAASCTGPSLAFSGSATTCGTFRNPVTCCPANFNHTGGLEVIDIFAFLNSWLAANSAADFNHSGILEQQDIFDYLNAWFASCN